MCAPVREITGRRHDDYVLILVQTVIHEIFDAEWWGSYR